MKTVITLLCIALVASACNRQVTSQDMQPENAVVESPMGTSASPMATVQGPVTLQLSSQHNSGQSGQALLEDMGNGKTKVTLTLSGETFTDAQPAHLHTGTCDVPGPVKFLLTSVIGGKSETLIEAPFNSLWNGDLIVNVHKSAKESTVYTACALLSTSSATNGSPLPTSTDTSGTEIMGY